MITWRKNRVFNLFQIVSQIQIRNDISENIKKLISQELTSNSDNIESELEKYLDSLTLVSCFSNKKDVLSQWRGYANDGKGVAIGFNETILDKILCRKKTRKKLFIDHIEYSEINQKKLIIQYFVNPILKVIEKDFEYEKNFSSEYNFPIFKNSFEKFFLHESEFITDYFPDNIEKLENILLTLKNPAFQEEDEVRIIYNTNIKSTCSYNDFLMNKDIEKSKNPNLKLLPIQYWTRDDNLVAYADLSFNTIVEKEVIKEIVIGPKSKVTEEELQHFLWANKFNYDINIEKSKALYR